MKKEARLFLDKAIDSLILSIEQFNRPSDRGRVDAVLIFLDHSFEMLLKAAIIQRGGKIRNSKDEFNIGFDKCLGIALSGRKKFLDSEQAIILRSINNLRDASQHDLLILSEQRLYTVAQAGLTTFHMIMKKVFGQELRTKLPERVLPISTSMPTDIITLFQIEMKEVEQLLQPGKRRHSEALSMLRGLAAIERAINGDSTQPSIEELDQISGDIQTGAAWNKIFPGVASINITPEAANISLSLHITKNEGIPVHLVSEGTPGAHIIANRKKDDFGYYTMSARQLAANVGLTVPKLVAVIRYLGLKTDVEYFKTFTFGKTVIERYSHKAIQRIRKTLEVEDIDNIWQTYGKLNWKKPKKHQKKKIS